MVNNGMVSDLQFGAVLSVIAGIFVNIGSVTFFLLSTAWVLPNFSCPTAFLEKLCFCRLVYFFLCCPGISLLFFGLLETMPSCKRQTKKSLAKTTKQNTFETKETKEKKIGNFDSILEY